MTNQSDNRRSVGGSRARKLFPPRLSRFADRVGQYVSRFDSRPLLVFFLILSLTIFFDLFDSFGLDDASERAWNEVADSIMGPLYGTGDGTRQGQDSIVVLLINDDTLLENGQDGLPLGYRVQAEILRSAAAAGPRAIFLDAFYPRARAAGTVAARFSRHFSNPGPSPDLVELADAMQTIGKTTPLLIGPVSRNADLQPLIDALANSRSLAPGRGVQEVSLAIDPTKPREYPVSGTLDTGPGKGLSTPAFGLYSSLCAGAVPPCAAISIGAGENVVIQWGLGVSRWRAAHLPLSMRQKCGDGASGVVGLAGYAYRGLFRQMYRESDDRNFASRCGYNDTINVSDLNKLDMWGKPMRNRLRGRVIFIGFDMPQSGDRQHVPFYGAVPGVLAHAMVFDNLVEWKGRAARAPESVCMGIDEIDLLQYAGLIAAIMLFQLCGRKSARLFRARDSSNRRKSIATGLIALLIILLWIAIAAYGAIRALPWATMIFGGILPGSLFGLGILLIAGTSRGGRGNG